MLHCTMNVAQAGEFRKVYECKPAARQMQGPISGLKNTVADMVKRHRAKATPDRLTATVPLVTRMLGLGLSGWDRRRMRHFRHSRPGRSGKRHGLGC
jgi:hypothetical protein